MKSALSMKVFTGSMLLLLLAGIWSCQPTVADEPTDEHAAISRPNVIFILSDDHRYDFMGFTGKVPYLETPGMDRMAREGVHFVNAFVTTSLCSPSRASILTGKFSHRHEVIDNQSPVPEGTEFFPEYLQEAGYQTAFFGKWHMGESSSKPRPGFDHWVSFRGQGTYYKPLLNINGEEKQYGDSVYISDLLTVQAIEWMDQRNKEKPFFMYLSHKGVHAEFLPAARHQGRYADQQPAYPPSMYPPDPVDSAAYNYRDVPDWVKKQRDSWHGVDYMYHGQIPFDEFYIRYLETLLGVDESIQSVLSYLEEEGLLENTLVIYMGDNGFSFGEHGLIDKRQAYEESIRVPMLAFGGGELIQTDSILQMVQNIDIGPTILDLAGVATPEDMDGASFVPLMRGDSIPWRERIYYEYFWERAFPQTPTVHAVRTDRYKFIRYYGVWDINELYDLKEDPMEMHNLIRDPAYDSLSEQLRNDIFDWLEATDGMYIPLKRDQGKRFDHKYRGTF
jgi:arylsulfatase A-like enzyme